MTAKKLLALLLALVLCVGTLAACSSEPQETTQSTVKATDGTTAATEGTTENNEPAELRNTDIYPLSSEHTFTLATARPDPEATVNWGLVLDTVGIDYEWRITAAEQTSLLFVDEKSMPDIFWYTSGMSNDQIKDYGKAGLLVNLREYLDIMPNLSAAIEKYPNLLDIVVDENGDFYQLPGYKYELAGASAFFYIRTDHTKAAGWEELPTTVEDFLLMCEDLKNHFSDVEGYYPMLANNENSFKYNNTNSQFLFPAFGELMQPGIGTNDDFTKIEVGFATEQFKRYITFMNTLYENGYLDPDCFNCASTETKARTNEGLCTMHPHATQLTVDNFPSGNLDFQAMPSMTSQYQSQARWPMMDLIKSWQIMISTTCPDIETAVKVLDACFASTDNRLNEEGTVWAESLWLGELGVDFTYDDVANTYEILPHEGFDSSSAWLAVAGPGNTPFMEWPYYENSGTGLMVKCQSFLDIQMPVAVDVFYTNHLILTEEERDIYSDAWIDIDTYVTEMNAAWITGQKDIETEWDNYIDKLYDMGLQDVIDVYQAALDRYNAK